MVGAVHLGVLAVDVLAREAEQLGVVGSFEAVPAWAVDRSHGVLLVLVMRLGCVSRAWPRAAIRASPPRGAARSGRPRAGVGRPRARRRRTGRGSTPRPHGRPGAPPA